MRRNVYVQAGGQTHEGIEASVVGRVTPELAIFGSAMVLDASFGETGDPSVNGNTASGAPKFRAVASVDYTPAAIPGLGVLLNWAHTGEQYSDDAHFYEKASSYDIVSLGVRYQTELAGKETTFHLNAENIFDEFYWASAQYAILIAGAPRTLFFSVSTKF